MSYLLGFPLRAAKRGAVLNGSPVDCQIRDLTEPSGSSRIVRSLGFAHAGETLSPKVTDEVIHNNNLN